MKKCDLVVIIVSIVAVLLGCVGYFNRAYLYDLALSIGYEPESAVAEIRESLNLTDRARLIFAAAHPALEEQEAFNEHCDAHDVEISVLGCYADNKIYLYDINSSELSGVKESTAAHELLHAVWDRMSSLDKTSVSEELVKVYNDSQYHDLLAEDLSVYDNDEMIDELHSRIGTEIADLPQTLETHYAKYFIDQDAIVDYYDNYIEPFRELSDEIDRLTDELNELDPEIDEKTMQYYKEADTLSAQIDAFNLCVETSCSNSTDLYARYDQLRAEQNRLSTVYDELSELVDYYNSLVDEYNDNILKSETLEKAINSNAEINNL